MLTQEGCRGRRQQLWERIAPDVEWLLIADPRHVQYLANFWVQPLSFSGGERGLLLLERDGTATLLADNFTIRSAADEPFVDRQIDFDWYDHKRSVINRDHALFESLREVAGDLAGRPGVIEAEWLPVGAAALLDQPRYSIDGNLSADGDQAADLGNLLRSLRRTKHSDEIELLRRCMRAGDAGHARAREVIAPGIGELEVYREVQNAAVAAAGQPALVYGDFRATNARKPKEGGLPTDYTLQNGDLFILDYSVVLGGYRSDFTNTYAVGEASAEQRELFELCQSAMKAGEESLGAGVPAQDVYAAVAGPFRDAGRSEAFPHHAGHGLGLAHPESPILVPESTDTLIAGDVVTLEPGAYVDGIGGMRIEHNYLVTEKGFERLSGHTIAL